MALFLLDMDGFKEINDTLGHPIGDDTLVEIASRLNAAYEDRSDVARLGGDEFCIIYPNLRDRDHGTDGSGSAIRDARSDVNASFASKSTRNVIFVAVALGLKSIV